MLISKNKVKNVINNYIIKNIGNQQVSWNNTINIIILKYWVENNLENMIKPFLINNEMINIDSLDCLIKEQINIMKNKQPELIKNGEIYRIELLGSTLILKEQELYEIMEELKR